MVDSNCLRIKTLFVSAQEVQFKEVDWSETWMRGAEGFENKEGGVDGQSCVKDPHLKMTGD